METDTKLGRIPSVVARSFREQMTPKQRLISPILEAIILKVSTGGTYRKNSDTLNSLIPGFDENELMKASTLCEKVERVGKEIDKASSKLTDEVLRAASPDMLDGGKPTKEEIEAWFRGQGPLVIYRDSEVIRHILESKVDRFNEGKESHRSRFLSQPSRI